MIIIIDMDNKLDGLYTLTLVVSQADYYRIRKANISILSFHQMVHGMNKGMISVTLPPYAHSIYEIYVQNVARGMVYADMDFIEFLSRTVSDGK